MTHQQMVDAAKKEVFEKAHVIPTDSIVFDSSFLKYCEENLCRNYGANYSCPPHCGTPQQMQDKIMRHKYALVLQSSWKIDDFSDYTPIREAKAHHNSDSLKLAQLFAAEGIGGLVVGASNCTLCSPCGVSLGQKCPHPDIAYSCMSAYCIHVKDLAEKCGMDYDFVPGRLSLFGMYVFD